jgi:hypothetical protein
MKGLLWVESGHKSHNLVGAARPPSSGNGAHPLSVSDNVADGTVGAIARLLHCFLIGCCEDVLLLEHHPTGFR